MLTSTLVDITRKTILITPTMTRAERMVPDRVSIADSQIELRIKDPGEMSAAMNVFQLPELQVSRFNF